LGILALLKTDLQVKKNVPLIDFRMIFTVKYVLQLKLIDRYVFCVAVSVTRMEEFR
jgi:hypothetical protein